MVMDEMRKLCKIYMGKTNVLFILSKKNNKLTDLEKGSKIYGEGYPSVHEKCSSFSLNH